MGLIGSGVGARIGWFGRVFGGGKIEEPVLDRDREGWFMAAREECGRAAPLAGDPFCAERGES